MIELFYWTTPNGHKITIFLEETGTPYRIVPINISKGEQFGAEFLNISPNNRVPAILDTEPADGGAAIGVFKSGAILQYLAEKTGKFLPADVRAKSEVMQWLFWQMAGLGPMAGQNHHFVQYAPEKIAYAVERYVKETNRLYGVLDRRLAAREFIAGDYSIADMAAYPWIVPYERQLQNLDEFVHVKRWFAAIGARPAVRRAYAVAKDVNVQPTMSEAARAVLFGQTAAREMIRQLYDLAAADPAIRFSPYCWRVKLALAHKNLPFETVPWRFTDKDLIAFSGQGRVPVLVDGCQVIHDSQAIAEYLETEYPHEASLFGDAASRALINFVNNWTGETLGTAIYFLVLPDIEKMIAQVDRAYFRASREASLGMSLEALAARREQHLPAFQAALAPLRATLSAQKFIAGAAPNYADHIVFGELQWGCLTSATPLLAADDVVSVWMRAVLESYGLV